MARRTEIGVYELTPNTGWQRIDIPDGANSLGFRNTGAVTVYVRVPYEKNANIPIAGGATRTFTDFTQANSFASFGYQSPTAGATLEVLTETTVDA